MTMTREEIEQLYVEEPNCFETDREEQWYKVGLKEGLAAADNSRWIPVEESLPEKDNEFEDYSKLVIVTNGKDFWKGMYNYGGAEWLTFDLWQIDDATHWMEFVPPQGKEE